MNRALSLLAALFALLFSAPSLAGELKIVATLPDLAALAREVAGPGADVTSIVLPTQDPHFVDARPNLALELSRADLLVLAGLELEVGWLPPLLTGARNPSIQPGSAGYMDCSQHVRLLQVPTAAIDRSMGDIHPGGNPHYFYDPRAIRDLAYPMAERLGQLDPEGAEAYQSNAADFVARLDAAIAGWESQLSALSGVPILQFHRSFPYLEDWLGFSVVGDIEPKPGIPPSPSHVAQVVGLGRQQGVKIVLKEAYYPDSTAGLVAQQIGAKLLNIPGGTDFSGGQSYIEHMDQVVALFSEAAGG